MRGMHSKESAQKIVEVMRVYYNTCREHSRLKVTPMEAAGLKIDLGQNKIESLIRLASTRGTDEQPRKGLLDKQ